mmetsp:Transcript_33575/g.84840  ORF Transcript_33575/g.84840 Transcript_33575/m.84840 type:complete len:205 (+) Transcript_33575:482-1096(+)
MPAPPPAGHLSDPVPAPQLHPPEAHGSAARLTEAERPRRSAHPQRELVPPPLAQLWAPGMAGASHPHRNVPLQQALVRPPRAHVWAPRVVGASQPRRNVPLQHALLPPAQLPVDHHQAGIGQVQSSWRESPRSPLRALPHTLALIRNPPQSPNPNPTVAPPAPQPQGPSPHPQLLIPPQKRLQLRPPHHHCHGRFRCQCRGPCR